jgi:hypothetical protein
MLSEDLALQAETYESAELRSDRQTSGIRRTRSSTAGPVNFELSYGTYDDWIAAVLCAANTKAQGTLTMDTLPTDGDTVTIGSTTYRFKGTMAQANDIKIETADLPGTKANFVATINGTGTVGSDYYAGTTSPHASVRAAAFSANTCVLTALAAGVAGDAIATTETFNAGTNVFDATTLGATREGTDSDTFTLATKTYQFDPNGGLANTDGHIELGATLEATQGNIVNAVTLGGTPGTGYAAAMTLHPSVTIGAFASNDAILTAKTKGAAGNSIATTSTFTTASNQFDDTTLGTTTAGVTGDTMTIDTTTYTFEANGGLTDVDGNIEVGTTLAATKTNIVNAIVRGGTPGTGYAASMTEHATVTIAAFVANDAVLTAKVKDADTTTIVTTETFAAGTNVFDAATLGATREGKDGDERFDLLLQGSNSASFASGVVDLAAVAVGAAAAINMSAATSTGRITLLVTNEFMGTVYRYLRVYTVVAGEHVEAGINYTARLAK